MARLQTVFNLIKEPRKIVRVLGDRGFFNWLPDKPYLKLVYRAEMEKRLDLNNPMTFTEKLQWLKLYDRRPEYNIFVDKYAVRSYIARTIGDEYLIPLLGVYNSVEEIDWNALPNKFVLKCTHGSGCNIICKDKDKLDIEDSIRKLKKWMNKNWYWFGREWPYKNVKPRIICEKYMVDESDTQLKDYKVFCFNGEPKLIHVDYDRFSEHKMNLYDIGWNYIPGYFQYPYIPTDPNVIIERPKRLEDLLGLARILAKDYPHVRIDFYSVYDKIYFGEMTFYVASGFVRYEPRSLDVMMGDWIKLTEFNNNRFSGD